MTAWLDENYGADGWAMTPSEMRGVLNVAVSIYFLDATLCCAVVCGGHPSFLTSPEFSCEMNKALSAADIRHKERNPS